MRILGWYVGEDMYGPYCPACYEGMGLAGGDGRSDADCPIFSIGHEADAPSHCAECDALIPHDLTPDGVEYVREAVREAAQNPGDGWRAKITEQWREEYLRGGA